MAQSPIDMVCLRELSYILVAALFGFACSSSPGGASLGQGGEAGAATATTSGGGMVPAGPTATLHGTVQNTAGEPIAGALLSLCSSACWGQATANDGTFSYVDVPADKYKLEVRGAPNGPAMGVVLFALELGDDDEVTLPTPIIVPETGSGISLDEGQQDVAIDPTLTLQLNADDLTLPFGETEPYLAGVEVAASHWPPNEFSDAGLFAQWSLNPFGAKSESPMGLQLAGGFGLRAGQTVYFYTVDVDTGNTERVAEGEVGASAETIATKPGEGIREITWLAVGTTPND